MLQGCKCKNLEMECIQVWEREGLELEELGQGESEQEESEQEG
jgi:hypothetical protein